MPVDRWVHIVASYTEPSKSTQTTKNEGKSLDTTGTVAEPRIELFFDGQRSASSPVVGACVRQLGRPINIIN